MTEARAAEDDQKLLARLVDIRVAKSDDPDGSVTDAAYAEAFRKPGSTSMFSRPTEPGPRSRPARYLCR